MAETLQNLLDGVADTYDKREGSFIYDALAPVAIKLDELDESISEVEAKLSIENVSGEELDIRVADISGLSRKLANKANGIVTVQGNGTVTIGDLFETEGGIQFVAIETTIVAGSADIVIEAAVAGSNGNVASETVKLFPVTLSGITSVTNIQPTTNGYDEESDEDFRIRHYEKVRTPITSGNKNQYISWAKEVTGVGDAKIIPLWNGINTVQVVIIDSNRQAASAQLISDVQDYIDPESRGLGEGVAPIGAISTVVSATTIDIDIMVTLILEMGYSLEETELAIKESVTEYLKSVAYIAEFISYAMIGSTILNSKGVSDYSELTVNTGTSNIAVGNTEVAVLGAVTLSE